LRTSSAGMHDEACEAVRRTRASGEAEAKQGSTKQARKITRTRDPERAPRLADRRVASINN
jgi:hypothetical protein